MLDTLDISTSGLVAQRQWMNTIAGNIANAQSTRDEDGNVAPFKRRFVTFSADVNPAKQQPGVGVKFDVNIDEEAKPRLVFQPGHPDANEEGNVAFPNIKVIEEFTNAMLASRAYEANIAAVEMTKEMITSGMRILG